MTEIKSLIPIRLVMTFDECFYCKKKDDLKIYQVDRLFGLRACKDHHEYMFRDCKAYMHIKNIVHIRDAILDENIKNLLEYFGDKLRVIRSNGDINDDWRIVKESWEFIPSFKKIKNKWSIMVEKISIDDSISKFVKLETFLDPKLGYINDKRFKILVNKAIASLDAGLYIDHFIAQPKPEEYRDESPNIVHVIKDGIPGRVFMV